MITESSRLRLMQLVSSALPIGMYSYSQGLEGAVEEGWVGNSEETAEWLTGLLVHCLGRVDLPVAARLYEAWRRDDRDAVAYWSQTLSACRETFELREEDKQTGQALARLLAGLELQSAESWIRKPSATLPTLFTLAAVHWEIPKRAALTGYLWSWLENQVLCAVKLVPLGQMSGQRLLHELAAKIPELLDQGLCLQDHEIGGSVFGLALAGSRHEMQYSRLFRS